MSKSIAFVKVAFPSATWEGGIKYLFMNNTSLRIIFKKKLLHIINKVVKSPFEVVKSPFEVVKSPFEVVKSTFEVVKSTFEVVKSTFEVVCHSGVCQNPSCFLVISHW